MARALYGRLFVAFFLDAARTTAAACQRWLQVAKAVLARAGWAVVREARMFGRNPWAALSAWLIAFRRQATIWATAEADLRRHWLLLPVFFGLGIVWFFSRLSPGEATPAVLAAAAFVAAAFSRPKGWARMGLIGLAMIPAGFAASALRLQSLDAPVLQRTIIGELTGFVTAVDQRGDGLRLLVATQAFAGLGQHQLPAFVRIGLRKSTPLQAGAMITVKARLTPPPETARPGGYDFARDAWFRQVGATGSAYGQLATQAGQMSTQTPWGLRLSAWVDNGRMGLTARIADAWGGQAGAVAAALVTGKRGMISGATNDHLRAAGIYHILSISGLHMVLAAGMFFWSVRALLALSPWCALRLPVRKIAAVLAMLGAAAYCIFSGSDVATQRSLIMIVAMLGAILVDRPALSMHNLAVAAMIVLVTQPESLLGPGFQMSFAAVAGLIVLAGRSGVIAGQPRERNEAPGLARRALWPFLVVVMTTLVCELATAPFSIWHFQSVYPLGLIGNAMALPFLSVVVMPAAVLGVALAPLGMDWPVWWVMGAATEPVLYVSARIAAAPFSVAAIAAPGIGALACLAAAIVWFVIWRTPIRWAAIVPALAGCLLIQAVNRPDIIADRTGQGALVSQGAARDSDGRQRLTLLGTPSAFVVEQWLRAIGDPRRASDPSLRQNVRCDPLACVLRRDDGGAIVWVRERRAFFDDCHRADVIVSQHRAPFRCQPGVLLDRQELEKLGAASVWLNEGSVRVARSRADGDAWPWTRHELRNKTKPQLRQTPQPLPDEPLASREEGAPADDQSPDPIMTEARSAVSGDPDPEI